MLLLRWGQIVPFFARLFILLVISRYNSVVDKVILWSVVDHSNNLSGYYFCGLVAQTRSALESRADS